MTFKTNKFERQKIWPDYLSVLIYTVYIVNNKINGLRMIMLTYKFRAEYDFYDSPIDFHG